MKTFLLAALAWVCLAPAWAAPPLPGHVLPDGATRPRIDGRLDDAIWRDVPRYTGFRQFRPDSQPDAGAHTTTVQVLIEPNALVFAFTATDPTPALIRDPLLRRDEVWPDQDAVGVWIDAVGRQQVAQFVRVNAAGVMADGVYTAATDNEDGTPDFLEVEAAAVRTATGYTVELRWPLVNLRYAKADGLPWRFMFTRRIPREPNIALVSTGRERNDPDALRDMHTLDGLAQVQAQWAQASHLTVRAEGTLRQAQAGTASKTKANLGLALQWRPRADWVVDALLRPDFSQVELDAPQLSGNTRFALFMPEKRAFFLESSDVVGQQGPDNWGVARGLAAFYSRAVAAPRAGLRATWRGAHDEATALVMRDAAGGSLLRAGAYGTETREASTASQLLFARSRHGLEGGSAVAGLVSLRDWGQGRRTLVAGSDALLRLSDTDQLSGHLLASQDSTDFDANDQLLRAAQSRQGHNAWLAWRHRGEHLQLNAHLESISANFANANGFVPQAGIRRNTVEAVYALHPQPAEGAGFPIYEWEWQLRLTDTRTLRDARRGVPAGERAAQALQPGFFLLGPLDTEMWTHANFERLRARSGGQLHSATSLTWGLGSHPGPRLAFVNIEGQVGEFLDLDADRIARGASWSAFATWRQNAFGWGWLLEQRIGQLALRSPTGGSALVDRSAVTKLVLLPSTAQALRLVHQRTHYARRAEVGLVAARERGHVTTLTWLAREGPLRNWSLGASWERPSDGSAQRREAFLKWQEGWAL